MQLGNHSADKLNEMLSFRFMIWFITQLTSYLSLLFQPNLLFSTVFLRKLSLFGNLANLLYILTKSLFYWWPVLWKEKYIYRTRTLWSWELIEKQRQLLLLLLLLLFWQMRVSRPLRVSDYSLGYMQSLRPTHTPGYYREKSHGCGPKILTRGFESKISWISWDLRNF